MKWRHPSVRAHLVINGIDRARNFAPPTAPKEKIIAYMPRKRPVEAAFIKDIFRYTYPEYDDWQWHAIDNVSEAEAAAVMARAGVFLALSRLESLGLSPLEAMASGCIVAGFTGIGGQEYARPENGLHQVAKVFRALRRRAQTGGGSGHPASRRSRTHSLCAGV